MRLLAITLVMAAVAGLPAVAHGAGGFDTGLTDPLDGAFGEKDPPGAYDAARDAGVRFVRVNVQWHLVAANRPANPTSPDDPAYGWSWLDERVTGLKSRGIEPVLSLYSPPGWARSTKSDGTTRATPKVDDLRNFATAVARRYGGSTPGVPRVRYWQVWNEPNLRTYLDQSDSVAQYRAMVTASYAAIHGVHDDNRVVAGGLAPYAAYDGDHAPLRFMRELLCMSAGSKPRPTCGASVPFDVWSVHPYTSGGPNRSARARDDVSLGDLPEVRRLLRAAERAGHVKPKGSLDFWVTEFSWDTKGPDPWGVPLALHARWVAEAFYNMWRNGVSMVVWFQLRDNPQGTFTWGQTFQSGLFFRTADRYADERAKPVREVVRFPFVALPAGRGAAVWGRVPTGSKGTVVVERRAGKRWVRVAKLGANGHGIFRRTLRVAARSVLRARYGSEASVPFKVERTRDRDVNPFGGPPGNRLS